MKIKQKLELLLDRFYAKNEISAEEMLNISIEASNAVAALHSSVFFVPIKPTDIYNIAKGYLTEQGKNKDIFIFNLYNDLLNQFNEYTQFSYTHNINDEINELVRSSYTKGMYFQGHSEEEIKEELDKKIQEIPDRKEHYSYLFKYMTDINNFFGKKIVINCCYAAKSLNEQRGNKVSKLLALFEVITTIEHECVHLEQDRQHNGFESIDKDAMPAAYLADRYEQEAILKSLFTAYTYVTDTNARLSILDKVRTV